MGNDCCTAAKQKDNEVPLTADLSKNKIESVNLEDDVNPISEKQNRNFFQCLNGKKLILRKLI